MAMAPLEIIAFLLVALFVIKMLVLFTKPKSWLKFAKKIYGGGAVTTFVILVLAIIVLYYLLMELSIVQIFAVITFTTLLISLNVAPYSKELMAMADQLYRKKNLLSRAWLVILIWTLLSIWVLWEIFA